MKNKALSALESLIGEWEYTMYNCWFLKSMDTEVKGFTTIERLHDAFVVLRSSDADKKPADIWVIGYSDPQEKYQMFYYSVALLVFSMSTLMARKWSFGERIRISISE
jgi:hypothetical protein